MQNRIAIITDEPGWHGRQLKAVFASRGFDSEYVSLEDCYLQMKGDNPRIILSEVPADTLAGVFVRGVSGGSLEQIIVRLNILHALNESGTVVYNDGRSIERTVDKALTSFLLKLKGIPTPDTWVCESIVQACAIIGEQTGKGNTLVMKPLFGSQGKGVIKIESLHDIPGDMEIYGDVYYLQKFIGPVNSAGGRGSVTENRDWRVFVINGRAEAMMLRLSSHWVTNRALGARCIQMQYDPQLASIAEAAVRAVGIDYAGVDLIQNESGEFMVTEINSVPAWYGLQRTCEVHIAERLADHFLARVAASRQIKVIK